MTDQKAKKELLVDPAVAFELWQKGLSSGQIAARFPGATLHNARYAAMLGARRAGVEARQGRFKREPAAPPLFELWEMKT
jgi:hypothetical protein